MVKRGTYDEATPSAIVFSLSLRFMLLNRVNGVRDTNLEIDTCRIELLYISFLQFD